MIYFLAVLDSTGSLLQAGGFQEGKLVSLAEFDQCLAVTSADRADQINGQSISGQYCLIKPVLPLPESMYTSAENGTVAIANSSLQKVNTFFAENEDQLELYLELFKAMKKTILRFGVCLPVQCKAADVERAINYCESFSLFAVKPNLTNLFTQQFYLKKLVLK